MAGNGTLPPVPAELEKWRDEGTVKDLPGTELIVTVAAITVGLSVYAHGLTAAAGASRYADWVESRPEGGGLAAAKPLHEHPGRRRLHHKPSGSSAASTPTGQSET